MFQRSAVQIQQEKPFAKALSKPVDSVLSPSNGGATGSVLNERRLREHEDMIQRDPNYAKNKKRFFGVPSNHSVQRSASSVQKFD